MFENSLENGCLNVRPQGAVGWRLARIAERGGGVAGERVVEGIARRGVPRGAAQHPSIAHVVDRHPHEQIEALLTWRVHDLDRLPAAEEPCDLFEWPHRGGQPDALRGTLEESIQALERERQVGAALGPRHGVDLVEDDRLDAGQRGSRLGSEHEVERLGRGDEDVGWIGPLPTPLCRGRVARTHRDSWAGQGLPQAASGLRDAHKRTLQVSLDIHTERLERREIQHPRASGALLGFDSLALFSGQRRAQLRREHLGLRSGLVRELIERPQERRECLTGTRRRNNERVAARTNRVPRLILHARGRAKGTLKPGLGGR